MATQRFIQYTDGRRRTSMRIEFTFGSIEMANALAANADGGYDYNGPPRSEHDDPATRFESRKQLLELMRQFLTSRGSDLWFTDSWCECLHPSEQAELAHWAAGEVRRLFPELDDNKLHDWEQGWSRG